MVELPMSEEGLQHLVLAVDPFSKFVLLRALPNRQALSVVKFLREAIVAVFGPPHYIRTDNGAEFAGAVREAVDLLGVTHLQSSPYHSQGNGIAERYIRTT